MFTATLKGEGVVDLRQVDRQESMKLHADRDVPWRCRGCDGRVHMRLHRGENEAIELVTFAHHPGAAELCRQLGFHTDESPQHHYLKDQLAQAAKSAGWDAELEVPGDGCRADVVVSRKGASSRVLEAQISPLGEKDAIERSEKYARSFGQPTWTHTRPRPWSKKVEALRVDDDMLNVIDGIYLDQTGDIRADPHPLTEAIPSVLNGRLRYVFFEADEGTVGYFAPIGAEPSERSKRRKAKRPERETIRGSHVKECNRPLKRTIPCVNCGTEGEAGRLCTNPICSPPVCPGCGRQPWHEKAICPECGGMSRPHSDRRSLAGGAG